MKLLPLLPPLLLACSILADPPEDLGLITDIKGRLIKLPEGRTDAIRFEVIAEPLAATNTIKFILTNQLMKATDMPLPNGWGLLLVRVEWSDGSYSRAKAYYYQLFKGETDGPVLEEVSIIKPERKGVVEQALAIAKWPPAVVMPPMPPGTEPAQPPPLPDAAPERMRHYYERGRRDGSAVTNAPPRSQIRRFRPQ